MMDSVASHPGEMEIYFVLWKYTFCYRNQDEFLTVDLFVNMLD